MLKESSRGSWEKITKKQLKRTYQSITKYTQREFKRNKLSLEDNLRNGVKLREESFKTTNSEYWHKIKNKDNEALKTEEGFIIY